MRCPRSEPGRQGGAALVVALLVFALCAAVIVAMEVEFSRHYQRAANSFIAEQSAAYLRGGEELAALALLADWDADQAAERQRDDLTEIWAQEAAPYPLDEGGWLRGHLSDLQGRFNLNSLAAHPPTSDDGTQRERFTPAQAQFIRLLQALGEPAVSQDEAVQITRAVTDWVDPDQQPEPGGAEDDYYFGVEPAYRAANRPMASVSELRAVAYMTPEIYAALQPWVTVWPQQPDTLNILTAPAMVLRSLNADDDLTPLSEAEGEALVEQREREGFADVDALLASPVFDGRQEKMQGLKAQLGEQSSWFLLEAEVEVAGRNQRLYSVLERGGREVRARVRAAGSL